MITTSEAAARLGVHRSRINVLIREGRLPAQRFGKFYLIDESNLKLVEHRPAGRPARQKKHKDKTLTG
jgi:excisionase family DNA binding protein